MERLDLVYGDGWDSRSRSVSGPMSPAVARDRDLAGQQYAVLLTDRGAPDAMAEVSSACQVWTVWHFDDERRRALRHELRRTGGDELILSERVRWRYQDRSRQEFDHATPRHTRIYSPDGLVHDVDEPDGATGGSRHRFGRAREWPIRYPVPRFGDPGSLARLAAAVTDPVAVLGSEPPRGEVALSQLVPLPWQPPAPADPARLGWLFRDGARWQVPAHGRLRVETRRVGRLRLPTGRLVAADARTLTGAAPFTVGAPPGDYPVTVSRLRRPESAWVCVAAVRVDIRAEPVAAWELALRPYRDPCTLGSWQFFGFEVATGNACLADASNRGDLPMADLAEGCADRSGGDVIEVAGPASAANGFAFPAAPGAYPTWLGRTADGEVACFLVDLLGAPAARGARGGER